MTLNDPLKIPEVLSRALTALLGPYEPSLILFSPQRKPLNVLLPGRSREEELALADYMDGPYLLDPYYRAGVEGLTEGLYSLWDLAPSGFRDSEYYRHYYRASNLVEEVGMITYPEKQSFFNFSLVRRDNDPEFSEERIDFLRETVPLVGALLNKYWLFLENNRRAGGSEIYVQLEGALKIFGSSLLTRREAEIMRMYLYGYNSKAIAERLGISTHTVSVHRKNSYAKLDITSQPELFSLFVNSMYCFHGDAGTDPLVAYLRGGH